MDITERAAIALSIFGLPLPAIAKIYVDSAEQVKSGAARSEWSKSIILAVVPWISHPCITERQKTSNKGFDLMHAGESIRSVVVF